MEAIKIFRVVGLQLRLPEQIGNLCRVSELDVGGATGIDVATSLPVDVHFVGNGEPLVIDVERTHECDPQLRRIDVVVDIFPQHFVNLSCAVARTAHRELRTARILVRCTNKLSVHIQTLRAHRVRKLRRHLLHLLTIEQIDIRKPAEATRIDREKEPSRFNLNIFDRALDLLLRVFADGEHVVFGDVAFLLRQNCREAHRTDLTTRLNAVVAGGDPGGQKARGRRLEGDIAHFESLQGLVGLSLIKDRDVVRGIEFARR